MPGDYGAVQDGQDKTLESFGAVDVQIRDDATPAIKYNLKSSSSAQIFIPISSQLRAKAKSSVTLWDYNATTGLWEDIGSMVKSANSYRGVTHKFSILNADVVFSNSALMLLIDNPGNPLPRTTTYTMNVFSPSPGGGAQLHHTITIDPNNANDLPVVVPRLAPNEIITIQVIDNTAGVTINVLNPRAGGIVDPAANLNPTPPYTNGPTGHYPNMTIVKFCPITLIWEFLTQEYFNGF